MWWFIIYFAWLTRRLPYSSKMIITQSQTNFQWKNVGVVQSNIFLGQPSDKRKYVQSFWWGWLSYCRRVIHFETFLRSLPLFLMLSLPQARKCLNCYSFFNSLWHNLSCKTFPSWNIVFVCTLFGRTVSTWKQHLFESNIISKQCKTETLLC